MLLRVALATEGAQEVGNNAGAYVERIQARCGVPKGSPWCACAVTDWGLQAFGAAWPLPRTAGCQHLADYAKGASILKTAPEKGDVFLIWHAALGRFGHTGLIVRTDTTPPLTISGNTTAPHGGGDPREGWVVALKPWVFKKEDRFIRWRELL